MCAIDRDVQPGFRHHMAGLVVVGSFVLSLGAAGVVSYVVIPSRYSQVVAIVAAITLVVCVAIAGARLNALEKRGEGGSGGAGFGATIYWGAVIGLCLGVLMSQLIAAR